MSGAAASATFSPWLTVASDAQCVRTSESGVLNLPLRKPDSQNPDLKTLELPY